MEQPQLFFSRRLSDIDNSILGKLKGYKDLGGTVMNRKSTRILKIGSYGLKFQRKGKGELCNSRKERYIFLLGMLVFLRLKPSLPPPCDGIRRWAFWVRLDEIMRVELL